MNKMKTNATTFNVQWYFIENRIKIYKYSFNINFSNKSL